MLYVVVVVVAAVMLGLYLIWLEVAPKSGIGTPETKPGGVFRGNELLLLLAVVVVAIITDDVIDVKTYCSYYNNSMNNKTMVCLKRGANGLSQEQL